MARVLIALPNRDFDPTEAAIPWKVLRGAGHDVVFATQDGLPGEADPRLVTGVGFGPLKRLLMADRNGRNAWAAMAQAREFRNPLDWVSAVRLRFDALVLPGGHAEGIRPYLESIDLQQYVAERMQSGQLVAAICHGVLIAARAMGADGNSALAGFRTTALPRWMELLAWASTAVWLGDYYRTYLRTVEDEVTDALDHVSQFERGPRSLQRDGPGRESLGFAMQDRHFISARWPGDAHRFAQVLLTALSPRSA